MGFAVLAFFYVVASSQIFPQINIAFYFGVQRYAIIAKNAIYLDKKVERGEKSSYQGLLSTLQFYLPLIIFSAELEVSLRVLAHRAKFGSFLTDMDMTAV